MSAVVVLSRPRGVMWQKTFVAGEGHRLAVTTNTSTKRTAKRLEGNMGTYSTAESVVEGRYGASLCGLNRTKKFLAFYRIRRSIAVFIRTKRWSPSSPRKTVFLLAFSMNLVSWYLKFRISCIHFFLFAGSFQIFVKMGRPV